MKVTAAAAAAHLRQLCRSASPPQLCRQTAIAGGRRRMSLLASLASARRAPVSVGQAAGPDLLPTAGNIRGLLMAANSSHPSRSSTVDGERVGLAFEAGDEPTFLASLVAVMGSGAVAVPLPAGATAAEWQYALAKSGAKFVLLRRHSVLGAKVASLAIEAGVVPVDVAGSNDGAGQAASEPTFDWAVQTDTKPTQAGVMLFTSGTTSLPKGVLIPESALLAQVSSLQQAWEVCATDRLLHVLPLHHIHGLVNALLVPVLSGAHVEFAAPFNASQVWGRLAAPFIDGQAGQYEPISIFTAVPTIYARLLDAFPTLPADVQAGARQAISPDHLRLAMSGSAALPAPIMDGWSRLAGGVPLLERYGMTEIGMALSCGLDKSCRVTGSVGWPLPGVHVRLVDSESGAVIEPGADTTADGRERQGEIQVAGPTVFREYWQNPAATEADFVPDETDSGREPISWFKTGDIAVRRPAAGPDGEPLRTPAWASGSMYFILGRRSADIIKTGGEKVSALEVEREMLALPEVHECAVVGLPCDRWGQRVAAVVVLTMHGRRPDSGRRGSFSVMDLRRSLKGRLSSHKLPQEMRIVAEIPRNAMGKVNKSMLVKTIFGDK